MEMKHLGGERNLAKVLVNQTTEAQQKLWQQQSLNADIDLMLFTACDWAEVVVGASGYAELIQNLRSIQGKRSLRFKKAKGPMDPITDIALAGPEEIISGPWSTEQDINGFRVSYCVDGFYWQKDGEQGFRASAEFEKQHLHIVTKTEKKKL